jgi:hypothetical protein
MLVMPTTFFDPRQFEAADHLERGCDLIRQNLFAEAITEFDAVLRIYPQDRYARWDRAVALLSLGDYANGIPEHDSAWELYDWRALGQVQGNVDRIFKLPIWLGERCKLLTYHEMGFGDAIMCLRFLPELVRRCESVTLVVRPELVRLMQGYGATVIGGVPPDVSGFDARVSFFQSISTMGYTKKTVPNVPYIWADFQFAPDRMSKRRMGIAWSGNSRQEFDLVAFLSGLDLDDSYEIFALQKSVIEKRIDEKTGLVYPLRCDDFKETAELMATLDCIVTVDTAAAHLAGAMVE